MAQPTESDDRTVFRSSPRLLAPDWTERARRIPAGAWFLTLLLLASLTIRGATASAWATAIVAVAVVFGGPVLLKYLNTHVVISEHYVEAYDSIRRVQRCRRQDIARIVNVQIKVLGPRFGLSRVLFVDARDHACLSLQVDAWSDEQLNRIYRIIGRPVTVVDDPVSPRAIDRLYPGSASVVLKYWPLVAIACLVLAFLGLGFAVQLIHP